MFNYTLDMLNYTLDIAHYAITLFVLLGGVWGIATSNIKLLIYHLFASTSVFIHWVANGNKCVLSELSGHEGNEFTEGILKCIMIDVDNSSMVVMYATLFFLIAITYWKLCVYYNYKKII